MTNKESNPVDLPPLSQPAEEIYKYFQDAQSDHEKMQKRKGKLIWEVIYKNPYGPNLATRVKEAELMRKNQLSQSIAYAETNHDALQQHALAEARADKTKKKNINIPENGVFETATRVKVLSEHQDK